MRILVPVKRVIDFNVRIRVRPDGSGVETNGVKMAINPFDEIAVEEAVALKEAGKAEEVIAVSVGSSAAVEILRTALAMGADRAILVKADEGLEPLTIAKLLREIVRQQGCELVIAGKQAIDGDNNQTGQMLAGLLGWAQATFASRLDIESGRARVTREIDGGLQTVGIRLPAVVTADLRLNEPRFIALPDIMRAKRKPVSEIDAISLGVDLTPRLKLLHTAEPLARASGMRLNSPAELVSRLREEGVI
jgi:electron transfer flavoprotein beta subunit